MALNRWTTAALFVSVLAFAGCPAPQPNNPNPQPTTAATTAAPVETPAPMETATPATTGTPAATPAASGTPSASATPGGTTAAAGGDQAAMLSDLENADGMAGYEEVKKMTYVKGDATKGAALFAANCASCHGDKGLGDGTAGVSLDPKPRNMTATAEYKYGHMPLAVYRTGMYGVEGTGMAPWDGIISPEDMWHIVAYVETLQK